MPDTTVRLRRARSIGPLGSDHARRVPADRREEMIRQLEELFLADGFARFNMDDLAGRLQCSKSTLYGIAPSREQLVVAVVRHFFKAATSRIEERVAPIGDAPTKVATYLAAVGAEMRRMSTDCYRDMLVFEPTRDIYERNSLAAAGRVDDIIREGVASGSFRAVSGSFVGAAVALLIDGIQHGELLDRTGLSSGDAFIELSTLVLSALTNRDGPGIAIAR